MTKPEPEITAAFALLAERWPKCFSIYEQRRRPLKVGIHKDILAAAEGTITTIEIGKALRAYTANAAYLRSMRADAARVDLDGNPAGTVSPEDSKTARTRLLVREKKKAASQPPTTPPKAPPPPKRLSLADLKAAAIARRAAEARAAND